ncbi:MAG: hypothetical protein A2Y00_02885 [Omnitrophica WOR_2 bacterium GWF2_43_52]|nr:MAG: hypothetical protein A2Y01_08280 [Omnitrophica WOR_2 bacterium GWC2_44_8]OGX22382.1 MAG: hypothetical protein A2Y00_02885 [Omnitrophica WOR_2 bacterium GWF2_43_52]OGX57865.1 MAG: hypothetical protein A2460_00260 [Omnitrophica WOR_2 bacterium RIFOXYC2_FULL_43_9]HAH20797.1 cobyrinic acid a,c-diamide synthase [Candidatus Omnitrophota bacterium]HBG64465.1 cobyrinic acid a,c-diamide synthase [Candidatus Omnitrophota bacterium]
MNYPRVIIAATQSGSGKTTIALGLMLALRKSGLNVQPFKAGPDYIDPTYHSLASAHACRNLDSWLLKPDVILELFEKEARKADISIIEGVMGLYDGIRDKEQGSTAHLAKILKCPVILILNAASLSRSAAAIALGYKEFDTKVDIAGIILNNIGSQNHYLYVKTAIEKKTKIPVLGFLPKDQDIRVPERHLGLIPTEEKKFKKHFREKLAALVEKNIDVGSILKLSRRANPLPYFKKSIFSAKSIKPCLSLAVARDKAFNFYYQDNLDILKDLGARLIEFSPLKDRALPKNIDGIYIGGGFPELFALELSRNLSLKQEIFQQAHSGLPIYAECGGLMYLVKKLVDFKGKAFSMVGIFDNSVVMAKKLQALGYIEIEAIGDTIVSRRGSKIKAHTFHWSYLNNVPKDIHFAYKVTKSKVKMYTDGLIKENVLASYAHLHFASNINFAKNFIKSCLSYKENNYRSMVDGQ